LKHFERILNGGEIAHIRVSTLFEKQIFLDAKYMMLMMHKTTPNFV
jgi:hypothetical protein